MKQPQAIAFFDFDGTITHKDSLMHLLLTEFTWPKIISAIFMLAPSLVLKTLGLLSRDEAKRRVLAYFFFDLSQAQLDEIGQAYCQRIDRILRPKALEKIRWHQRQGHRLVLVSASCDFWLAPWAKTMGFELISTQLALHNGRTNGQYLGQNCRGAEKVRRIKAAYNLQAFSPIYAYGDTSGDRPMLDMADEGHYRVF